MKKQFKHILSYTETLSVIEEVGGQTLKETKTLDKGKGPFVIWVFENGDFISTPCGATVKAGDSAKTLAFGFNEKINTIVGFRPTNITVDEIQEFCFDSKLTFGMHKGLSIQRVIDKHGWSYMEWCVLTIPSFLLSETVCTAYIEDSSHKESVINALNDKRKTLQGNQDKEETYVHKSRDYSDYKRESFEAFTDGEDFDYEDFNHHGGDLYSLLDSLGY